jgi:hypothetical protein
MADYEAPEVDSFDEGQAEDFSETIEPPQNVLNLDEYDDYVVELNGEYLPVSELKGGGLRQADYTRKTQELADQRRELERAATLERALEVNPQGTLKYLAEQYGLTVAEAAERQRQQQAEDDWWADEDQDQELSPLAPWGVEQRLAAIEQRFQMEEAEKQLTQVFDRLKAKYGDDFDAQEVARAATARNIFDPNLLEDVYRSMAYEKLQAARQAASETAQTRAQQEEQRRQQAARQAASVTGASGGAVVADAPPPPPSNLTVREAAELAWRQLGYGDDQ